MGGQTRTRLPPLSPNSFVPVQAPVPLDPEFVQLIRTNPMGPGWPAVAHLCVDAEMQDHGVDVRLWAWPTEYKYQGGSWWKRNHMDDREWHKTGGVPLQIRSSM